MAKIAYLHLTNTRKTKQKRHPGGKLWHITRWKNIKPIYISETRGKIAVAGDNLISKYQSSKVSQFLERLSDLVYGCHCWEIRHTFMHLDLFMIDTSFWDQMKGRQKFKVTAVPLVVSGVKYP